MKVDGFLLAEFLRKYKNKKHIIVETNTFLATLKI